MKQFTVVQEVRIMSKNTSPACHKGPITINYMAYWIVRYCAWWTPTNYTCYRPEHRGWGPAERIFTLLSSLACHAVILISRNIHYSRYPESERQLPPVQARSRPSDPQHYNTSSTRVRVVRSTGNSIFGRIAKRLLKIYLQIFQLVYQECPHPGWEQRDQKAHDVILFHLVVNCGGE